MSAALHCGRHRVFVIALKTTFQTFLWSLALSAFRSHCNAPANYWKWSRWHWSLNVFLGHLFRCWASHVGFHRRSSMVSIGNGCEYKHVMVHELGHVIGFWHEQSRPDRDNFVSIVKSNILPSKNYVPSFSSFLHGEFISSGSLNESWSCLNFNVLRCI